MNLSKRHPFFFTGVLISFNAIAADSDNLPQSFNELVEFHRQANESLNGGETSNRLLKYFPQMSAE